MMLLWYPNRKTKGFDVEEKLVYQIIEEAGNKGKLWLIQSILFLFVCLFVCSVGGGFSLFRIFLGKRILGR